METLREQLSAPSMVGIPFDPSLFPFRARALELCADTKGNEIASFSMKPLLDHVERQLPELLLEEKHWKGMQIEGDDLVRRLSIQQEDYRVCLHEISPFAPGVKPIYHYHQWPAIVHLLENSYIMGMGFGAGEEPPAVAMRTRVSAGQWYEMIDPDTWHYVAPENGKPTYSVMITGKSWRSVPFGGKSEIFALQDEKRAEMFEKFRTFFPVVSR